MSRDDLVAPYLTGVYGRVGRRWEGNGGIKPWDRQVTATFAHLETPDLAYYVVELLRLQTVPPHVIIVDTGSSPEVCAKLEKLRDEDVEVHFIRSHGYRHSSGPVGMACDVAQSMCFTPFMFWTHSDCFLRRRDYIEDLVALCGPESPVVGYEMSPRDWITNQWEGMFSHTATLTHMPTWFRLGVTWSFERAHFQFGIDRSRGEWPDTETGANLILRDAGVKPILIGHERNFERFVDDNVDHFRSFGSSKIYSPQHHEKATLWRNKAVAAAELRIARWRQECAEMSA